MGNYNHYLLNYKIGVFLCLWSKWYIIVDDYFTHTLCHDLRYLFFESFRDFIFYFIPCGYYFHFTYGLWWMEGVSIKTVQYTEAYEKNIGDHMVNGFFKKILIPPPPWISCPCHDKLSWLRDKISFVMVRTFVSESYS